MAIPTFLSPSLLAALIRRPTLTLLPRVPVDIRLHEPEKRPGDPRRLNLFAGRALGEREFERLQAYVDERVAPLLTSLAPGIVEGLSCDFSGNGADTRVRVQFGLAAGGAGQLVRLFYPLDQAWTDLAAQAERDQDAPLRDGLFFVTIRSAVEPIDDPTDMEPCTRTEPEPLRERRIETVCLLGLQRISGSPSLMAMPQPRAANRICARLLRESPLRADSGAVPLGLVKVVGKLPVWFDPRAGRLLAEPDAAAHTLLAHTVAALDAWQREHAAPLPELPTQALAELIGLDYLPAAGPLPAALLRDPASKTPGLAFLPRDLQIELAPVPADTIEGVVAGELARGSVDLIHGLGERLRLLLAIPDLDYRRDLFDLPQRDTALEDELFHRGQHAAQAWQDWKLQWQKLYKDLTQKELDALRAPLQRVTAPRDPDAFRDDLVAARRAAQDKPDSPLPEPYASHLSDRHPPPADYAPVQGGDFPDAGLFRRREDLRADIRSIEAALDKSFRLLDEVNDYLGLQRQRLDALTVSFSALAGGVAGDGLGANLVRWTTKAAFLPKIAIDNPEKPS
jgi:hypothetical protein